MSFLSRNRSLCNLIIVLYIRNDREGCPLHGEQVNDL